MAISQKFIITSGPGKWDLMLAMFDDTAHPHVRFDIQGEKWDEFKKLPADHPDVENYVHVYGLGPKQIEANIQSLGKEDGSGENWYFELYVADGDRPSQLVRGYYNTQRRKGCMLPQETTETDWFCDQCQTRCSESIQKHQGLYGGPIICSYCFDYPEQEWADDDDEDNEDPLEGAVEPVGGTPSKDHPLYDRHGMLIGHAPIEEPSSDSPDHEDYDI